MVQYILISTVFTPAKILCKNIKNRVYLTVKGNLSAVIYVNSIYVIKPKSQSIFTTILVHFM